MAIQILCHITRTYISIDILYYSACLPIHQYQYKSFFRPTRTIVTLYHIRLWPRVYKYIFHEK